MVSQDPDTVHDWLVSPVIRRAGLHIGDDGTNESIIVYTSSFVNKSLRCYSYGRLQERRAADHDQGCNTSTSADLIEIS